MPRAIPLILSHETLFFRSGRSDEPFLSLQYAEAITETLFSMFWNFDVGIFELRLVITQGEMDKVLDIIEECLDEVGKS
jgi:hypothetical protein